MTRFFNNSIEVLLSTVMRGSRKVKLVVRRLVFKLLHSLPVLSRYIKPINLTTFKTWCTEVNQFPTEEGITSKGWYLPIRKPEAVQRQKPSCLNNSTEIALFEEGSEYYQNGYTHQIPEVFLSAIPKARIVDPSFLVISPDNCVFSDSTWADFILKETGILDRIKLPKSTYRSGTYILLGIDWWQGYYHWMIDVLPRLSLLEQFETLQSIPIIVPAGIAPYQYESLRLVGISPDRIIEFNADHWQVDLLYFPSPLGGLGNPSPWAITWLREHIFNELGIMNSTPSRFIYITRRDARIRRIINEDQIIELLKKKGFEIVCPGELSFAEQVRIFAQARVVIGPHGAGLTNMVFAPHNALLIELFPDNYVNGCYWALANANSQTYAFLTGRSMGKNFEVSLDKLETLLGMVMTFKEHS